jgi:hypothetical protein
MRFQLVLVRVWQPAVPGKPESMKVLVLTSEPVSVAQLRDALGDVDPADAEVMVVAPAYQDSPLKFWVSDADEAIARAEEVRAASVEKLGEGGVNAGGETGESDPLDAIQDALQTFSADRIVLFTRPDSKRFREDIDENEVRERFGIPVEHASLSR